MRDRIDGFGKAIATSFLMDYNPKKYCLWNNKVVDGLLTIGWKAYERRDPWGEAYLKVVKSLQRLINLKPEFNLNFDDTDLFLHTIFAEEEGKQAVKAISEGEDIPDSSEEQLSGFVSMEFVMERYLEEFIESNFARIDFGTKLELYQNEESSGRQYPTNIGPIDLLAIDKAKKEFVVIELKKGRGSDAVIGQILRYMGWVKENLAKEKGYCVRGIIIVRDKDEKMEYALQWTKDVNLFKYNISFDIEKII